MYFTVKMVLSMGSVILLISMVSALGANIQEGKTDADTSERIYGMKKCSGSGCPYTASWLAHVNLYRKIPWWLDSTKMEAASFNM